MPHRALLPGPEGMSPRDKLLLRADERTPGPGSEVSDLESNADRREHPTPEELGRFLSDTATREERRRVAVHLLRGCESCALVLRGILRPGMPSEGAYDEMLSRFTRHLAQIPALRDIVR